MQHPRRVVLPLLLALSGSGLHAQNKAEERAQKVQGDKKHVEALGVWIYDDLPRGIAVATSNKKPLLVVFRCIPCEACAQLDERVVERDPIVQKKLDEFVCVRIPHTNGMDLRIFQFDFDQSWAAFFLNADMTIYGRYGTRSSRTNADADVSLEGFAKALDAALELHAKYPGNREALARKRGPAPEHTSPEQMPTLKGRFSPELDWQGKVVPSCIHCHMVAEAQRSGFRRAKQAIPEELLFSYPNPSTLGLVMDPKERAKVKSIAADSPAAKAGFAAGDEIVRFADQPIVSIADLQWVLHGAPATGSLAADILRGGKELPLVLTLAPGWRTKDDLAWRASSWDLRRMVTGGLVLEEWTPAARKAASLAPDQLGLRVAHVGQYGDHAAAKKAGFQVGDVVVALAGRTRGLTESQLLAELVRSTKPGDKVEFTVLRDGKTVALTLPMQ